MTEITTANEQQLEKLLASGEFQSSRQVRHFLEYTAGKVLRGSTAIDQFEIAEQVLGKSDFDPTVDASVRKLATQVRQRLARYYQGQGASDAILVTLPLRSYSPQFSPRDTATPTRPTRPWLLPLLASLPVLALIGFFLLPRPQLSRGLIIETAFGDIKSPVSDPAPGGLLLGPSMQNTDEITARLSFSPTHEGQHAGILIWAGPLQYVALGRRFTSRNQIALSTPQDTAAEFPDVEGQSGLPVWLRLRRQGDSFTGFISPDGNTWSPVGAPLQLSLGNQTRAAIFAVNGRRDSPSIPARFAHASIQPLGSPHWHFSSTCPDQTDLAAESPLPGPVCQSLWSHSVPATPTWSFTTRVETSDTTAISAGLYALNQQGRRIRLVRYRTDTSTIALIEDGRRLVSVPDYPGRPPIYLRLRRNADGSVSALHSLDGENFSAIGKPLPLPNLTSVGLIANRRESIASGILARAHFLLAWQDLDPLAP